MIRQSKTAIKELTARYRSVLRHAFLCGVVMATGTVVIPAHATLTADDMNDIAASITTGAVSEPNATAYVFDENHNISDATLSGTPGAYTGTVKDNWYSFNYNGGTTTLAETTSVNKTDTIYQFTSQADTPSTYDASTEINVAHYTYDTANASGVALTGAETADATLATTGYTYKSWDNATDISIDTAPTEPQRSDYTWTGVDGETEYNLADFWVNNDWTGTIPVSETASYEAQKAQFITDTGHYGTELSNYNTAQNTYNTDNADFQDAVSRYLGDKETLSQKVSAYNADKDAFDTASTNKDAGQYALDTAINNYNNAYNAYSNYNDSLGKAVDDKADSRITNALADGGDIANAISTAVSGKQDVLTTAQQTAVDSGIDSTKVEQIATNASAIDTINSTLDTKANASDVYTKTQAQEIFDEKEAWISQELGYDTRTTDARTELANNGFNAQDLLGALVENKDAIATNASAIDTINSTLGTKANASDVYTKTDVDNALSGKADVADTLAGYGITDAYTQTQVDNAISAEANLRSTGDSLTLAQAMAYTDEYAANVGALTLKSAKAYTDERFDNLEKDMSAGIASAAALSAVEVTNVKRGEVSVGGGYGYHNSQSAVAFGAAMGLTDNWSVNAGAGISGSNTTFRAGTNYKFKLF